MEAHQTVTATDEVKNLLGALIPKMIAFPKNGPGIQLMHFVFGCLYGMSCPIKSGHNCFLFVHNNFISTQSNPIRHETNQKVYLDKQQWVANNRNMTRSIEKKP